MWPELAPLAVYALVMLLVSLGPLRTEGLAMSLKRIRLLIWKEFIQLRRDPLLIRLLLLMPVLQLILFGYVVAVDVRNLSTAVVDLDRTATSRQLESAFSGVGLLHHHPAPGQRGRPASAAGQRAR